MTIDAYTMDALLEAAVAGIGAVAIIRFYYHQSWMKSLGGGVVAFVLIALLFAPIETHTVKLDLPKRGGSL